jgi:hypothetical protein
MYIQSGFHLQFLGLVKFIGISFLGLLQIFHNFPQYLPSDNLE